MLPRCLCGRCAATTARAAHGSRVPACRRLGPSSPFPALSGCLGVLSKSERDHITHNTSCTHIYIRHQSERMCMCVVVVVHDGARNLGRALGLGPRKALAVQRPAHLFCFLVLLATRVYRLGDGIGDGGTTSSLLSLCTGRAAAKSSSALGVAMLIMLARRDRDATRRASKLQIGFSFSHRQHTPRIQTHYITYNMRRICLMHMHMQHICTCGM